MNQEKSPPKASPKPYNLSTPTWEFLRRVRPGPWSFFISLAGAAGGAWLGHSEPTQMDSATRVAASLIAIIIGAVIAALAMITRACDSTFLKTAKAADKANPSHPILPIARHLSPFFTVTFLGILSGASLLALSAIPSCAPEETRMAFCATAGFFTVWTLTGLPRAMGTLIHFTYLVEESIPPPAPTPNPPRRDR